MRKGTYSVEVTVTRFYRGYFHADEGEKVDDFIDKVKSAIIEDESCLMLDYDLSIEEQDILRIVPNFDGLLLDDEEDEDANK